MTLPATFSSQTLPVLHEGACRTFSEVAFSAQAAVLAALVRESGKPVMHVVPQDKDMATLACLVAFLDPSLEVLSFPAWDTLPYDRVSPSAAILSQRLSVLGRLAGAAQDKPYLLLTTLNAISQKLPPREQIARASFSVRVGEVLNREALLQFLHDAGYHRTSKVMEAGEFAVRGALIDLFPAGNAEGMRIDCFGEEVESIKPFDPLSQLSSGSVKELVLLPVSEVMLTAETIASFREQYLERFGAATRGDPLYEAISQGHLSAGMEHWLPLFYPRLDTLAEYTAGAILSRDARVDALHDERMEAIRDYYGARVLHAQSKHDGAPYHPIAPETLFLNPAQLEEAFKTRAQCCMTAFAVEGATPLRLKAAPQLYTSRHEEGKSAAEVAKQFIAASVKPVIIAANSPGSADRIGKLLQLNYPLEGGAATITILPIESGYEAPDYVLLSEQDLFGERIIRTVKKKRPMQAFMQEAAGFVVGEAVVHREHGIGRYEGLLTLEIGGAKHDCLKLSYDGGTLFLPVENIDLISRYGATEGEIALDKLGGIAWQKRKSILKKRLKMAAEELLKVAAERAAKQGTVFESSQGAYDEFCRRFPYTETEDQLQAIEDVRVDLHSGRVTDRLICGDVGFGKTEVAMRAAFVAASGGAQVAVVAPTTLLARQHYHTFKERFAGMVRESPSPRRGEDRRGAELAESNTDDTASDAPTPTLPLQGRELCIRMLSRLVSAKEAAQVREDLAEGRIDIIVGTHALLADTIQFKQLGLLIVDEEQHFGVAQKEKLKKLKSDVHVLTLSATPIPRTLQMALSGLRELSLITTPPIDRLAVRTYVMPVDWVMIREALMREYHRGGKSFYVTPRVKFIDELSTRLREHVPELKVAVAHGQMGAVALDRVMNEFYDGKYDVLLSTAIIESGIDVPTANTMIIDRAQLFGLSQLYQLRGRVGRSKVRAYAYFTMPHHHLLTRDAERRLTVMQQLDSLGAGFQLASHDMDIRGFGNLLGEEQSGHIKEVGIELYQSMFEEAVEELRRKNSLPHRGKVGVGAELADQKTGETASSAPLPASPLRGEEASDWSPQINLGMSVLIPESYIEDLSLRLSLYRRAGGLTTPQMLESFAAELIDRFGPSPEEVEHFLAVLRVKILCKSAGIARLDAGPKGVVLAFRENRFAEPQALLAHIAKHAKRIKLRADQTLFVSDTLDSETARLRAAHAVAQEIAGLLV